jgi:hypothetical protein
MQLLFSPAGRQVIAKAMLELPPNRPAQSFPSSQLANKSATVDVSPVSSDTTSSAAGMAFACVPSAVDYDYIDGLFVKASGHVPFAEAWLVLLASLCIELSSQGRLAS